MFFGHCVGLGGAMMNWVALVRVHFPADPDRRWNATRMLLAAMHIQYYTINAKFGRQSDLHTSKATAQEEPISDDEWQLMRERHLLTREESDVVRAFRGYRPFLPLVWALEEVESAFASPSGSVTPSEGAHGSTELRRAEVISSFRAVAFEFRGHCGQITNWLKQVRVHLPISSALRWPLPTTSSFCVPTRSPCTQPVPFPYFHVLTILMLLNLLLLSYALVTYFFSWCAPGVLSHASLSTTPYSPIPTILLSTCSHYHRARRHPVGTSPSALLITLSLVPRGRYLTLGIYFIIVLVFLGLREVAICMSDPFGDDPIDFDLEPMLLSSYHNAVATLADARAPAGAARNGLENPLISAPNLTPLLAPVAPPPGSVRLVVNDDGSLRQPLTR